MYRIIFPIIIVIILLIFMLYISQLRENKDDLQFLHIELYDKLNLLKEKTKNLPERNIDYPVFYINMDQDKDRRDYIESQLKKVCKEFYRIKGVEGFKINNTKKDTIDNINFINDYESLTKSEIGCALSHLKAIKTAYDMGKEYAIIIEDDLSFDTLKLNEPISEIIKKVPRDWEIIQLSVGDADIRNIKEMKIIKYSGHFGAMCYLINKKGMEKIFDHCLINSTYILSQRNNPKLIFGPIDFYIYYIAKTYTILPSLFIVNNSKLESTIHQDHTGGHINFANRVLDYYLKKINV